MTFTAHKFEPTFHGLPTIRITEAALTDMWYITSVVDTEVGWWCLTRDLGENVFLIDEVMLPKQECHHTTTEITPEGECEMIMALNAKDQAEGIDICGPDARVQRMRAWFHSHGNMGTTPSSQDLAQVEFWRGRANLPWFIRGIVNKAGRLQVAFYDFRTSLAGVFIEDVGWEIQVTPKVDVESDELVQARKLLREAERAAKEQVDAVAAGHSARWRAEAQAKVSRLGLGPVGYTPYTSPPGFEHGYNYGNYFTDAERRFHRSYKGAGPRGGVVRRRVGP